MIVQPVLPGPTSGPAAPAFSRCFYEGRLMPDWRAMVGWEP